ncbi:hypothetical protein CYMTET_44465 [Cymbomonas tetramitiformis]|uniref:GRIP domain-containing protein n=1 Tax=Cymbomonas tetramitiformis TaxID=36881 RepID=A0AAE0C1D4_9CHLO|nr:hypothetical protein CYMTET_44465 [Cymbomonas tetramitiformis]
MLRVRRELMGTQDGRADAEVLGDDAESSKSPASSPQTQSMVALEEPDPASPRAAARDTVDLLYLKNVLVKYLEIPPVEQDKRERLLPVISMLLQFSPDELKRIRTSAVVTADADDQCLNWIAIPNTTGYHKV